MPPALCCCQRLDSKMMPLALCRRQRVPTQVLALVVVLPAPLVIHGRQWLALSRQRLALQPQHRRQRLAGLPPHC